MTRSRLGAWTRNVNSSNRTAAIASRILWLLIEAVLVTGRRTRLLKSERKRKSCGAIVGDPIVLLLCQYCSKLSLMTFWWAGSFALQDPVVDCNDQAMFLLLSIIMHQEDGGARGSFYARAIQEKTAAARFIKVETAPCGENFLRLAARKKDLL